MVTWDVRSVALDEVREPPLRPLPVGVVEILLRHDAPPRLVAHLRAVHDVALRLVAWVRERHPNVDLDGEAVLFGAATHDIGKTRYTAELRAPGSEHEMAGRELLRADGVSADLARFAATHASWTARGVGLEDLLVSLADKAWKNQRVPELEDLVVARLAVASGRPVWEEFMDLDDVLARIGDGADARLAFQMSYPVRG